MQQFTGRTTLHYTRLTALFPELPGRASTRNVKPIWILLKYETVSGSGSGISWAHQHPTTQFFYRPDALPAAQPTVSTVREKMNVFILCIVQFILTRMISVSWLLKKFLGSSKLKVTGLLEYDVHTADIMSICAVLWQEYLLSALAQYVDNRSNKSDAFVVKTQGTVISKNLLRKVQLIIIYANRSVVLLLVSNGLLAGLL